MIQLILMTQQAKLQAMDLINQITMDSADDDADTYIYDRCEMIRTIIKSISGEEINAEELDKVECFLNEVYDEVRV